MLVRCDFRRTAVEETRISTSNNRPHAPPHFNRPAPKHPPTPPRMWPHTSVSPTRACISSTCSGWPCTDGGLPTRRAYGVGGLAGAVEKWGGAHDGCKASARSSCSCTTGWLVSHPVTPHPTTAKVHATHISSHQSTRGARSIAQARWPTRSSQPVKKMGRATNDVHGHKQDLDA
jgi:hypothetical protein